MSDVAYAPQRPADSAGGPGTRGRPLRRRSTLPTGRAVVGGLLVALSALGIFASYTRATAGPTHSYAVARRDLPIGTQVTGDDLLLLPMDLPPLVAEQATFSSVDAVVGATVVGPLRRGELVQPSDVVRKRSAPAELEVSFSIDSSRALAGSLRPGEEVLTSAWGRGPHDRETAPYWRQMVELNRNRLVDPNNADLLIPGQVIEVPSPPAGG